MSNWAGLAFLGVAAAAVLAADAKNANETFTDPAKAGPDFAVQGEYESPADEKHKLAAQVIAEGGGAFTVRFLMGGLPGAGWDGKTEQKAAARTGAAVSLDDKQVSGSFADGKLTVRGVLFDNEVDVSLRRVERKSPTLGAKPPEGAVVLFDGSGKDEWKGGSLVEGKLLSPQPGGLTSKRSFGDCTLHIEFLLPFMPRARGQGRANSGVYLQGLYEVQVLDSFGLKGLDNECGGLYSEAAPRVNMCLPPLAWQTYDIDLKSARYDDAGKKVGNAVMTVRHNGVAVHDKYEIKQPSPDKRGRREDAPGPIFLQDHGNPVYYRNVWVLEKQ
jgi:hypothetical protein